MKINIASEEIVHFIGIGGIGMSGLAQIMDNMGFQVQGSDLNNNKNIERLKKRGIKILIGHKDHPEVIGTMGQTNKNIYLVEIFFELELSVQ